MKQNATFERNCLFKLEMMETWDECMGTRERQFSKMTYGSKTDEMVPCYTACLKKLFHVWYKI